MRLPVVPASLLLLALLASLSACTAQPHGATVDADDLVCSRESPTGTLMVKTHCRTGERIDHDKKAAGELTDTLRSTGTGGARPGGLP